VKANFRSSQLSLPIAIAPAADPPARTTLRDDLPEQLARLTEAERTLLRLKALVGVATNKSDFLTMANASVIAALGGVSLTYNMVNPMLNRLLSLGLLNANFSVESLRHPLAIEMIAAPEGGKAAEAVRRIFPAALNRSVYYSYSPQSDPGARVRLRLAIYENDGDAFRLAIAAYDKAYSAAMGPHILEDLFADTILDVSWLASRDLDIQFRLFWVKLGRLLSTGQATAECRPFWPITATVRTRPATPNSNGRCCVSIFWPANSSPRSGRSSQCRRRRRKPRRPAVIFCWDRCIFSKAATTRRSSNIAMRSNSTQRKSASGRCFLRAPTDCFSCWR
jgi:hypothetical protein